MNLNHRDTEAKRIGLGKINKENKRIRERKEGREGREIESQGWRDNRI
jgi:hypothetical protein